MQLIKNRWQVNLSKIAYHSSRLERYGRSLDREIKLHGAHDSIVHMLFPLLLGHVLAIYLSHLGGN